MFRKDLIGILRDHPMSVRDLALLLETGPREIEDDLHHLFRSLRNAPLHPAVIPARCRKCGFTFGARKLRKPGKCPRCRATWISEPLIGLEERR